MAASRRLFAAFLLLCVALALGDAPYVDEFLADLATAHAAEAQLAATGHDHGDRHVPAKRTAGTSRICQNLLNLTPAPDPIPVSIPETPRRVADTAGAAFSSASLPRIDRPPAPVAG